MKIEAARKAPVDRAEPFGDVARGLLRRKISPPDFAARARRAR